MSRLRQACLMAALALAVSAVPARAATTGIIFTVAGSGATGSGASCGNGGFGGDGGLATDARLNCPRAVGPIAGGGFLVADRESNRVRRVWPDGTITTVAGSGTIGSASGGFAGDGGAAIQARLDFIHDAAPTPDGGFLISDTRNQRIRYVSPAGSINTIAGSGPFGCFCDGGFTGDGGQAIAARLSNPHGLAVNGDGSYLVADTDNNRVRRVATDGTITTVAGSGPIGAGNGGFGGDGGPATSALLNRPFEISPTPDGGFLIADTANEVVRKVSPAGTITTVAGVAGQKGFAGDRGPATQALLNAPTAVVPTPDGGFLIADDANQRVRAVAPNGTITTVAGSGSTGVDNGGFAGDDGPATKASLNRPKGVAMTSGGDFLIVDENNHRIRLLSATLAVKILKKNLRVRRGGRARLPYKSTLNARTTLVVKLHGKRVARLRRKADAGRNRFTFRPRLTRELELGRYRLVLTARGGGGQRDRDRARVRVKRP